MIKVYFEKSGITEHVATFYDEDTYGALDKYFEDIAVYMGYERVTESVVEEIKYEDLNSDEVDRLHELVFQREYNPRHEDDWYNAGGFFGHWNSYTPEEQQQLIKEAKSWMHSLPLQSV